MRLSHLLRFSISAFVTLVHQLSAHQNSLNVLRGWETFGIGCTQGRVGALRYWRFSDASQGVTGTNSCFLAMKTQRANSPPSLYFLSASTLLIAGWVINNNCVVQEKWKMDLQGSSYIVVSHIWNKKQKIKIFCDPPNCH